MIHSRDKFNFLGTPQKPSFKRSTLLMVTAFVLVGVGGMLTFQNSRATIAESLTSQEVYLSETFFTQQAIGSLSDDQIVERITAALEVPTGEQPIIATVTDPSEMTNQAFFKNAKSGDKLVIYTENKLAILYDPTANRIVEAAPISP